MVTFDPATAGTSARTWQTDARMREVALLDLAAPAHLIVVAAHPDDETLGAAGLMRAVDRAGGSVDVIIVTDGSASHPRSSTTSADELITIRRAEVRAAVARLAPAAHVHECAVPDGHTAQSRAAIRSAISGVAGALDGTIVIASTWRGDGHRDHRVVGEICAEVAHDAGARLLEYPIWLWHWGSPDQPEVPWQALRFLQLGTDDVVAKSDAIGQYASQVRPLSALDGDEAVLGEHVLEHFTTGRELFVDSGLPSTRAEWFDGLYSRHADPWGYDSRWYEERKRAVTLAALRRRTYERVLELGCSTGALSQGLLARSQHLVAVDAAPAAIERARARLGERDDLDLQVLDVRNGLPTGRFDLVVISEVGYYLEVAELADVLSGVLRQLTDRGELLLCHWKHESATFAQTALDVHAAAARLGLYRQVLHEEADFLLELYTVDANSVARLDGLA